MRSLRGLDRSGPGLRGTPARSGALRGRRGTRSTAPGRPTRSARSARARHAASPSLYVHDPPSRRRGVRARSLVAEGRGRVARRSVRAAPPGPRRGGRGRPHGQLVRVERAADASVRRRRRGRAARATARAAAARPTPEPRVRDGLGVTRGRGRLGPGRRRRRRREMPRRRSPSRSASRSRTARRRGRGRCTRDVAQFSKVTRNSRRRAPSRAPAGRRRAGAQYHGLQKTR